MAAYEGALVLIGAKSKRREDDVHAVAWRAGVAEIKLSCSGTTP